jgi:hypothetical protein
LRAVPENLPRFEAHLLIFAQRIRHIRQQNRIISRPRGAVLNFRFQRVVRVRGNPQFSSMPKTTLSDAVKPTGFGGFPVFPVSVVSVEYPQPEEISAALIARTRAR